MSSGKVYYWLKLNKGFFEDDTITWIEEQENGKDYIIFYLKLALKSLQDEGYLIRYVGERLMPYDVKALAKLTNTSPDTVAVAMKLFIEIGLISRLDSGEIYLNQIDEMIGSETESAKRVRKHRAKKEMLQSNNIPLQCNNDVIKSNTEIELDTEIELELNKKVEKTPTNKDVDAHFEKMWSLYPEKRVKKQVSSKSKKDIYKLGEEFERCITRYKKYVEGRRKTDFKDLSYQNGSTFFNGGYMDYLDENVKGKEEPKRPPLKKVYREL